MQSAPSGLLRISVATDFGVNHLSPVLGDFLTEFPDITVNMVLNNRYVELISEGFDMAVRIGELNDGQSLLNACVGGLGIAYLPSFLYADAMKQGLVEEAIPDLPVETQGIYAVYPPGRGDR